MLSQPSSAALRNGAQDHAHRGGDEGVAQDRPEMARSDLQPVADSQQAVAVGDFQSIETNLAMAAMFFFQVICPIFTFPAGEVVVEAPKGVEEDRWIPVFM